MVHCHAVLEALTEAQQRAFRWNRLCKIVAILQHLAPIIAVKVVDSSTSADDQVSFFAKWALRSSNFHMIVWIVTSVHRDDCLRWTPLWKHADQDEICVVDIIELWVAASLKSIFAKHVDASLACIKVRNELVRIVL